MVLFLILPALAILLGTFGTFLTTNAAPPRWRWFLAINWTLIGAELVFALLGFELFKKPGSFGNLAALDEVLIILCVNVFHGLVFLVLGLIFRANAREQKQASRRKPSKLRRKRRR